jgi:hypothetical protein
MGIFLHQDRREPALEEMPYPMMPTVVRLGRAPIQLAHAEREVGLRRFDQEMIVVVHQAIGMAEPAIAMDGMGKESDKL